MADDPHVLERGHHPTPFTAAEIRAASPRGHTVRQLIEVDAEPPFTLGQEVVDLDDDGATRLVYGLAADGTRLDPGYSRANWLDLQRHASMPIETTTVDEVVLESPMGSLDCLRYTRRDDGGVDVFWFARSMPGMPVLTERIENGRVVKRVTMLVNEIQESD